MNNTPISNIKKAVKEDLDALVTAGVLGAVIEDNAKLNLLTYDYPDFPAAILTDPEQEADYHSSHENQRTYNFDILIIAKGENTTLDQLIKLKEDISNQFDTDPSMNGEGASGYPTWAAPVVSKSTTIESGDKCYIVFLVTIKARVIVDWR
jgi:glutamine amidotransferase PdxT